MKTEFIPPHLELSASLLACPPLDIRQAIKNCLDLGIKHLHLDVMDHNYVPNLALNYDSILAISNQFPECILDIHLMVKSPMAALNRLEGVKARRIFIHTDSDDSMTKILRSIDSLNAEAGITLNPNQSWNEISPYLTEVKNGLIMGVNPGFSGQKLQNQALESLIQIQKHPEVIWSFDGGVNYQTLPSLMQFPLTHFVLGSALFSGKPEENIKKIQSLFYHTQPVHT